MLKHLKNTKLALFWWTFSGKMLVVPNNIYLQTDGEGVGGNNYKCYAYLTYLNFQLYIYEYADLIKGCMIATSSFIAILILSTEPLDIISPANCDSLMRISCIIHTLLSCYLCSLWGVLQWGLSMTCATPVISIFLLEFYSQIYWLPSTFFEYICIIAETSFIIEHLSIILSLIVWKSFLFSPEQEREKKSDF